MDSAWGSRLALMAAATTAVAVVGACSQGSGPGADTTPSTAEETQTADEPGTQPFPAIVDAAVVPKSDTTFDIEVTVSSPYDTPERYADGWRVLTPEGDELGSHTLLHDHATEQPFTRVQPGLEIPADISTVVIEGRDLVNGYGGRTVEAVVPGR